MAKIIYTKTDEAPALATYSFLPIVQAFASTSGIEIETRDISLAGRIISSFPDYLNDDQKTSDALKELGILAKTPEANIIKLPNISASIPQLKAAIKELQLSGYGLPEYPEEPKNEIEQEIKSRYDKIKGSAVNPVLREGNSDRRAPKAVKEYAKNNPHSMGKWETNSQSHVSHMNSGDFRSNEKSVTIASATTAKIVFKTADGETKILKDSIDLFDGEIIDCTFMSKSALIHFLKAEIAEAKSNDLLFSLHMKATMMKVSDPVIFCYAVRVFFENVFTKHNAVLEELGVDVNN